MKKQLALFFVSVCLIISTHSFAQVDSSKIADTQQKIDKNQKKADRLEKRANKKEKKIERQKRKMERKENKRDRKLKKVNREERKLDDLKKDSTGTGFLLNLPPSALLDRHWYRLVS